MDHDGPIQAVKAASTQAAGILAGMRVLVVDDSPTNLAIVGALLTRLGIAVQGVATGALALEMLAEAPFDLVLMDIELPAMDGYETTSRIRRQLHLIRLPIVAMTAHDLDQADATCHPLGFDGVVTKPVDLEVLLAVLRTWRNRTRCGAFR
jgi:two-component system, sensor histidine kinase and response regulator